PARREVRPQHSAAVTHALAHPSADHFEPDCFCEIEQLSGEPLTACQNDVSTAPEVDGSPIDWWCYIDHDNVPTLGNEKLVEHCASGERRTIRFVGAGEPQDGALAFVMCQTES